ncbi:hypothetical protein KKD62_03985 [Patescibacteria group bacterium]|nr:hypothetical protein [Patescibacteria group bacterium]MBU1931909.1 hypothetical protein [Patescibacteria group bacterium]
MINILLDLKDFIVYDVFKKPLPEPPDFTLKHNFVLHKEKNGGSWMESKKYPGLIASGDSPEELREALLDSILTYFDVPRAYAKRLPDTLTLNLPNGKTILPPRPRPALFEIKVAIE